MNFTKTSVSIQWCAGFALILGCAANHDADPTATTDDALAQRRGHQPPPHLPPPSHGPGQGHGHGHGPGHFPHFPGHGPGHGHGHGPGQGSGAATGSGGTSSGSTGGTSSGGTSNGSAGRASGTGGTAGTSTGGTAGSGTGGSWAGGPGVGVCGDLQVDWNEGCDDGNTAVGDGCSADCQVEPGYTCDWGAACRAVTCGDGSQDEYADGSGYYLYELCDDGNTTNGDGCGATCIPEIGWNCSNPGRPCHHAACGDGVQESYVVSNDSSGGVATGGTSGTGGMGSAGMGPGTGVVYAYEDCDDGNTASGDGCDTTCRPESGYVCDRPGEPCRQPVCGDGYVDAIFVGTGGTSGTGAGGMSTGSAGSGNGSYYWEECDDGNDDPDDFCSNDCHYNGAGGSGGTGGTAAAGSGNAGSAGFVGIAGTGFGG